MTSYSPPVAGPGRRRPSRGLVFALAIVGLAVVMVLALLAVLLLSASATTGAPEPVTGHPIVSALPSATSPAPSPASPLSSSSAPSTVATSTRTVTVSASRTGAGAQVKMFAVVPQSAISGATVTCTKAGNLMVDFVWSTSGATTVAFGIATLDASATPYAGNLPPNGSLGSGRAVVFQCYADTGMHTQFYTLTVLSPGQKVSRTITLKEKYVP